MGELYRKTVKPQMLLKKSFTKTKNFLLKTLHNLNNILFRGHHKLPKVCYFNPFFSSSNQIPNYITQQLDDFHWDFSQQWDHSNHNEVNYTMEDQEKNRKVHEQKLGKAFLQSTSKGHILAQKMKELGMMDEEDLDQMLDIEEVLYYYSCLTCPVYLDIVDWFFMDMYNEFSLPQPSINFNISMRNLGPIKL